MNAAAHVTPPSGRLDRVMVLITTERFRWVLVVVFTVMLAVVKAGAYVGRDPYWGARAGLENLSGGTLVREDTWSWSTHGVWYQNSPLWNNALGAAWHWLGYWGIFLTTAASILAFFALAWNVATRMGARPLPGLVAMIMCTPFLSGRATLVVQSLVLLAALLAFAWSTHASRMPAVANAASAAVVGFLISLLGNWIHLSFFALGPVVAVMWACVWFLTPELSASRAKLMTAAGTTGILLGPLLSPYGVPLTVERSRAVQQACEGLILEWSSVFDVGDAQWYAAALLALAVTAAACLWIASMLRHRGRADARLRLILPLTLLGAFSAVAGLGAIRFLGTSFLVMAPVAAAMSTRLADIVHRLTSLGQSPVWAAPRMREYTSGRFWTVVLLGVGLVLAPGAAYLASHGARPPEAALIDKLPRGCLSVTDGVVAGPLILARPDVKVWIDGRADFYGREHLGAAYRLYLGVDPIPEGATCALFPVASPENRMQHMQASLDADPTWVRLGEDKGYRLWARTG